MNKISVIVPVYNVEKYLGKCVDSIVNQTYENLEIILVDDGSPDKCPQICDDYAKQDKRIRVVHKKNGGLSSARNAGLDVCTGDFVCFVDSDDWINLNYYTYCINLIEKYEADAVQIVISFATDEGIKIKNPTEKLAIYHDKEILQNYMDESTATGTYSACRRLYRRSAIGDNRFREGKIHEDIDWVYRVLSGCHTVVVSNQVMYYNYLTGNSLSQGGLKKRDFDLRDSAAILVELTSKETYGTIKYLGEVKQARTAFSLLSKIAYYGISDPSLNKDEIVKSLIKEHRSNVKTLLMAPIAPSRKMVALLLAINFNLAESVVKIAKRFVGL